MTIWEKLFNTLGNEKRNGQRKLKIIEKIIHELKAHPYPIAPIISKPTLYLTCRRLLYDSDSMIRSGGLRILRYAIWEPKDMRLLLEYHIDIYICRSIERESKLLWERMQAFKLLRRIQEIRMEGFPLSCLRSIIAIASYKDDKMRRVCVEFLRETAIHDPILLVRTGGFQVLIEAVLDPSCQDFADSILCSILFILNDTCLYESMNPLLDLQILLSPFTDIDFPSGNERRQRWIASKNALCFMMKSWNGIQLLSSHERGLASLFKLATQPIDDALVKAILSTTAEFFGISTSIEMDTSQLSPENSNVFLSAGSSSCVAKCRKGEIEAQQNSLENYMSILLVATMHCGIIKMLVYLYIHSTCKDIVQLSLILLDQILELAAKLLPSELTVGVACLPSLVEKASGCTDSDCQVSLLDSEENTGDDVRRAIERRYSIRASSLVRELAYRIQSRNSLSSDYSLQHFWSNGTYMASELLCNTNRSANNIISDLDESSIIDTQEQSLLQLRMSLVGQMDETTFRELVYQRSRVLTVKEWYKWDWDIITDLLDGPLTISSRMTEILTRTKFFKRLSGFFRCDPSNKGYFAQLAWIPDYIPYIRPACQMYTLLLHHIEGLQFLKNDRRGQLLSEIASALELEARPEASIVESHIGALQARMFSPEFCTRRMLREYLTLLGLMSSSQEGLSLLEQSNLFHRLYILGKKQGHDFLCRLILANLDYTIDGNSRNVLQLWATDGSTSLRLYAICVLRSILHRSTTERHITEFSSWGIDVLVTQLHSEPDVVELVIRVLEEAVDISLDYAFSIIQKRPRQLFKEKKAYNLLLKLLVVPEGYTFLQETGWAEENLEEWRSRQFIEYAMEIEKLLFAGVTSQLGNRLQRLENEKNPVPIPVRIPLGMRPSRRVTNKAIEEMHIRQKDLLWLFRLPWNIEIKATTGNGLPSTIALDTFVDSTQFDNQKGESLVRIRGIVVDAKNASQPMLIGSQDTLHAGLFLGIQIIDRLGQTKPAPRGKGGFIMSHMADNNSGALSFSEKESVPTQGMSNAGSTGSTSSVSVSTGGGRLNNRVSIDAGHTTPSGGYAASRTKQDNDVGEDEEKDLWCICTPEQRFSGKLRAPESSLCIPGERVKWYFKVETDKDNTVKRLWLKEVEYVVQLIPGIQGTLRIPPHIYGQLAETDDGCSLIDSSRHLNDYLSICGDEKRNVLERRGALWVIGHLASKSRGYMLLKSLQPNFLDILVHMATMSSCLALRGTCLYVLGLASRMSECRKELLTLGWVSSHDCRFGICFPLNTEKLFQISVNSSQNDDIKLPSSIEHYLKPRHEWKEVIRLVGDLSSHIIQKETHAALNQLKVQNPGLFESPELFLCIHRLLELYRYRLSVRQYIYNLFDKAIPKEEDWLTLENERNANIVEKENEQTVPIEHRRKLVTELFIKTKVCCQSMANGEKFVKTVGIDDTVI